MPTQRIAAAAALSATLLLGGWRVHPAHLPVPAVRSPAAVTPDACALLSTSDVSTALEVGTPPGKRVVASSPAGCIWSSDASNPNGGRRVTLSITTVAAFDGGKTRVSPIFTIVPVGGVGDDAYYEVFKSDSPYLVVKKGGTAFTVRVLNGLKLKAFDLDQEKAKELVLGQAASGRL